jgi:serine/threonine-protein kinase
VPFPDEVAAGAELEVDVTVGEARLALKGEVLGGDFDEHGNVGVSVALDLESWNAVRDLDALLSMGESSPALFATTRMKQADLPALATPAPAAVLPEGEPLLAPGALVDSRFRIERHLASGGMGDVYRAEHVHLKRPIALKLLKRVLSTDPQMWSRFEREAQLVSKLESPHVVRVFDFGKTPEGALFLAMEFVEGETLEAALKAGPLEPARAVEVLGQVLEGLAEAHALGMVHRDLKPANVILGTRRGGGLVAKILDFGIARLADRTAEVEASKLTQLGVVVGTPAYLSPEQALADELDHRTDIYALGCVAYELLTGKPPFTASELRKVISLHLTAAPEPLEQRNPALAAHPSLCAAVLKALSKEKERRFQSVAEFRAALGSALAAGDGEEVLALAEVAPDAAEAPGAWPPPAPAVAPAPSVAPPLADDFWSPVAPAPVAPPVVVNDPAADDFFASVGAAPITGARPGVSPALASLAGVLPPAVLERLAAAAPEGDARGVTLRLEVLGPAAGSPAAKRCAARALEVAAGFDAFVAASDDEGWVLGFAAAEGQPAGRAVRALHVLRDAVVEEGLRQRSPANVKAMVAPGRFPLAGDAATKLRQRLVAARAGDLWCDEGLAGAVADVTEVSAAGAPAALSCAVPRRRVLAIPELTGRKAVVEVFDRRLQSLAQGVAVPLVVKGPAGCGRTALAAALASGARKRNLLAVTVHAGLTPGLPAEALVELVCAALNLEFDERFTRLPRALEGLSLTDPVREAVLALCGVRPFPGHFSPGQAAHAARVVLRAVAGERPMVVIFDGLERLDDDSFEAFRLMAGRPASRELVVGLAAPSARDEALAALQAVEVPALGPAELFGVAGSMTQALPGPRLQAWVTANAGGLPARVVEGLSLLDDRGALRFADGTVELAEASPAPEPGRRWAARLEVTPLEVRGALAVAAVLGPRFDPAQLAPLSPRVTPGVLARLQASGFVQVLGSRQWRFREDEALAAALAASGPDAPALHARRAAWLIERAKVDAVGVTPADIARHLAASGNGTHAAPAWKAALERAVQRRDLRGCVTAWKGMADAIGLLPPSDAQLRGRVDALSRAAACALGLEAVHRARALVDEAVAVAPELVPPPPERSLVLARVLRAEGRRVKAAEVLAVAEGLARGTPVMVLALVERGEAREQEGDLDGAIAALEAARPGAEAASELARWHGEVSLPARLEARLATVAFGKRDGAKAQQLLEASLARWRQAAWPYAEARALSTLGTVHAYLQRFEQAAQAYEAAGVAAARCGDLLFQAKAQLQQARALKKLQGDSAVMKAVANEARKLALALNWEQGRLDAEALAKGAAPAPAASPSAAPPAASPPSRRR